MGNGFYKTDRKRYLSPTRVNYCIMCIRAPRLRVLKQCALSHLSLLLPPSKTRSPGHHGAPTPRDNCIWCLPRREEQLTPAGHVMGLSEGWSFEEMTRQLG